jgi:hypothetical protein
VSAESLGRAELPGHHVQRPIAGWPDWYTPNQPQIVVSKAGNKRGQGHVVHVPDPTTSSPAPACDHPWPDAGFKAEHPSVYPHRRYCKDCPWQHTSVSRGETASSGGEHGR